MSSENDLRIGVEFADKPNESFLPFEVQTGFWLIHEKNVRLLVFCQSRQKNHKNLFLTA